LQQPGSVRQALLAVSSRSNSVANPAENQVSRLNVAAQGSRRGWAVLIAISIPSGATSMDDQSRRITGQAAGAGA